MSKQERPISQPSALDTPSKGTVSDIWVREAIYLTMPGPVLMSINSKKHNVTMTESEYGILVTGTNVKRLIPWSNVVHAGLI